MAGLFGFENPADAYRYRCSLPDAPSNADCFGDFARRLKSFFHGEHPTRITRYHHQPALDSVQPARTVYTGNYVFRPRALQWFIPFAPLRLRMSGPTLGRLMKAELGARFISANLPMLHTRTLGATGAAEFRPGVVTEADHIDLTDEFERQFFGDVMLFTVERLTALGFPQRTLSNEILAATLDAVHADMAQKYCARQVEIVAKLAALTALLNEPAQGWQQPEQADALTHFRLFLDNMQRNFGVDAPGHARIASNANWQSWRQRQLAALTRFHADHRVWSQALAALKPPSA
ncbi:MAG: alginate lyase family protein, partial [Deltaproteobacteria bacterium]|nr:alginate lyase family protein [Deltaproteobacteria bacterium]